MENKQKFIKIKIESHLKPLTFKWLMQFEIEITSFPIERLQRLL